VDFIFKKVLNFFSCHRTEGGRRWYDKMSPPSFIIKVEN
jgi:hypothetical protein